MRITYTVPSGQIVGERRGTAFPFRFWRGNAVPLAYTTAVGGRGGTCLLMTLKLELVQLTSCLAVTCRAYGSYCNLLKSTVERGATQL